MNILFINATYGIGSTGTIIKNMCSFLSKNGHNCFIACQKSSVKENNVFIIGNVIDWKLHAIQSRLFGDQAFHSTLSTRKIKRIIKNNNINIVNIHNIHSNFINYHSLLKIIHDLNVPVVLTLHDCWFFTGKCFHYIDANCNKFKGVCSKCPKLKQSPVSFFFDRTKSLQAKKRKDYEKIKKMHVVGCSDWISAESKQSILSCAKNIITIRNGIDTTVFNYEPNNLKESKKVRVLGMANKFRLPKNAELVEKLFNDDMFDFTICGCSGEDYKYFSSFSNKPNLLPVIKQPTALKDIYSNVDVFLNLTFADTFPTVNLEAICCGTPVVVFNRGGASEIITDDCGRIVSKDDYDELKKHIFDASKIDKRKCAEFGKMNFDESISYKKYLEFFTEIVEDR